jgi:NAD(P)H-hydrate epimerase
MVIDADGLNALAGEPTSFACAAAPRVLTPHPGEMGRLLGLSTAEVQKDRIGVARRLARESRCVVVLKGAATVVTDPGGKALLIPAGNPGMATGGTGDVLTGIIGAFLAQGMDALSAASVGAMVHALAGDEAAAQKGQRALIASDLIESLPDVFLRFEGQDDEDDEDDE